MLLCSVPPGARPGKTNIHCLHQHLGTQTGTHGQTPLSGHTFTQSTTGARRICPNKDRHRHTQSVTPTCTTTHTRTRKTAAEVLLHSTPRAHGGENIHNTQTHRNTLLHTTTAPPHTMHTHTHYAHARTGNGNGGTMVKSGNIKVNLRSGAALPQERTRTHTRTSNRIL